MSTIAAGALDMQLDLGRWTKSAAGQRMARAMASAQLEAATEKDGRAVTDKMLDGNTAVVMAAQLSSLDRGETFAVSEEIGELVLAASESLPDFTLHETDTPCQVGFIWLERAIPVVDWRGNTIIVKALGWNYADHIGVNEAGEERIVRQGIVITTWTDPTDPRDHMHDYYTDSIRRGVGAPPLSLLGITPHEWNEPISAAGGDPGTTAIFRFVYALWRFMQETYIDTRSILPGRPAQKRAIRAGRPTAEVKVIRLRKREQSHGDGDHLEDDDVLWSHRWLVKGHWRNQWYPSQDRHAPKWISGYVKGPEHLPLFVKDTVFSVDR